MATTGTLLLLIAIKEPILPVPAALKPMLVLLFVQLNTVPATGPLIVIAVVLPPLHTAWLAIVFTDGVGFTVIVKVIDEPEQVVPPLVYVGVTVIVAVTGALVALVAMKLAILPVPLAANPILVVLFVQL